MTIQNKVQLITYPDSLGGNLKSLGQVLEQYFLGLFPGGVHILPPFPSTGDRGFAPQTYLKIDPAWGSWTDIQRIGEVHPVLLDLIVNHISARSPYFQDYLLKSSQSAYAKLFLPIENFWPGGVPDQAELDQIFLRRPKPFSQYRSPATGEEQTLWTTFGKEDPSEQVDINVDSAIARELLQECLATFSKNGVKIVRLDAVGFVIKKLGTSCFFVEPEIFDFLDWLRQMADSYGIELLPEVHGERAIQKKLAENGYWTYDFILPYLVLEASIDRSSKNLKRYLAVRPHRQFTMLDCHDGIPVIPDLNGLLDIEKARKLADICLARGGSPSLIYSPKYQASDGFNIHQLRGTFYSLLGCDDQAYLIARAIQLFVPGVPQVYYVGLLAGKNDPAGLVRTGDGREINRHNYSFKEIDQEVQRPIVQQLIRLIRFRNTHPAFDGEFNLHESLDHEVSLRWTNGSSSARLYVNLQTNRLTITCHDAASGESTLIL